MNRQPAVTVIMAAYNAERYIAEAIQSVLGQTFGDFELLIVDDGSTDRTSAIIQDLASRDRRIRALRHHQNQKYVISLNDALREAQGKYIVIMDADDVAIPNRLERQHHYLKSHPEIFLLGTAVVKIDEIGKEIIRAKPPTEARAVAQALLKANCLFHPSVMYRNVAGLHYREKMYLVEDYDYYLRLLTEGKQIANLPDTLLKYRISHSSVSLVQAGKQALFREKAKEFYWQRVRNGRDDYENFNPETIRQIDIELCADKLALREEIRGTFRLNNFARVRRLCRQYFRHHGILNFALIYYLASFADKRLIEFLRKFHS